MERLYKTVCLACNLRLKIFYKIFPKKIDTIGFFMKIDNYKV
jgi:hypothetical protein